MFFFTDVLSVKYFCAPFLTLIVFWCEFLDIHSGVQKNCNSKHFDKNETF